MLGEVCLKLVRLYQYIWTDICNCRKENCREGELISKTDLRKVQNHQEKRTHQSYLRESETQTETGIITACVGL